MPVKVHFFLSDISAIDGATETFQVKAWVSLEWRDERNAFDSASEGASERLYQGHYQFYEVYNAWWPQLSLDNGVDTELRGVTLRIAPDGTAKLVRDVSLLARSPLDLRRFPFDRQDLLLILQPAVFGAAEVELISQGTDLPERGIRVPDWELLALEEQTSVEAGPESGVSYSILTVRLRMGRKPAFIIWSVFVPLSLIVMLSLSVFWMSRESLGDRMGVSFIGLLTIVAYQSLVGSQLPNLDYFTLTDGFVYVAYLTMAGSVLSNLYANHLDRSRAQSRADRFDRRCRWMFPAGFLLMNVLSALFFYFV